MRPLPAARIQSAEFKNKPLPLYEVVFGERRWRASKLAGLTEIPAFWRDLTDKEVLEMQLIENVQREDVHPLEEAEGYQHLIKDHGYTAETLAEKIGVSMTTIYNSRKLLALDKPCRDAFYAGELSPSHFLLLARIPHALQPDAFRKFKTGEYGHSGPMSYRDANEFVQKRFMVKLSTAPFSRDDATLVPTAGACGSCPKRTGNQKEIFEDIKSGDVCTDPGCFNAKAEAHVKLQREAAKERGQKVISGKEAEKIAPNGLDSYSGLKEGFLKLDDHPPGQYAGKTIRQLLGKDAPLPTLLVDPRDKTKHVEVLPKATIAEHLKAKGVEFTSARGGKSEKEKAEEQKRKQDATWRQRMFDKVRTEMLVQIEGQDTAPYLEPEEEVMVTLSFFRHINHYTQSRIAKLWHGPEDKKQDDHKLVREFTKRIETMSRKEIARLQMDMVLIGETQVSTYGSHDPDKLLAMSKTLGIDTAAIKTEIIAEAREKAKPKKGTPKKTAVERLKEIVDAQSDLILGPLKAGDRVRINDTVRSPTGKPHIGKEGILTAPLGDAAFFVRVGKSKTPISFATSELIRLTLDSVKTAPDADPAAQAGEDGAEKKAKPTTPAAPASGKATTKAKTGKAKTKADPATPAASNEPANFLESKTAESAALVKNTPAWPFPLGSRPAASEVAK